MALQMSLRLGLMAALAALLSACAGPGRPAGQGRAVSDPSALALWRAAFAHGSLPLADGRSLPYRIMTPPGASNRPLVIVLHGSGAMGSDNAGQLGGFAASWAQLRLDTDAPIVVVPQVAERSANYVLCNGGPCASLPGPSFEALLRLTDHLLATGAVDPRRVHVVGFSMGGSAALQLALARRSRVARVLAFAPVPPARQRIRDFGRTSVTIVHGSADNENPFAVSSAWALAAGRSGAMVWLCVRNGLGHQVPDDLMTDPGWKRRWIEGKGEVTLKIGCDRRR